MNMVYHIKSEVIMEEKMLRYILYIYVCIIIIASDFYLLPGC